MKKYEFVKTVRVEKRTCEAGLVVAEGDLPAGHVQAGLRAGHLKEVPPETETTAESLKRTAAEQDELRARAGVVEVPDDGLPFDDKPRHKGKK